MVGVRPAELVSRAVMIVGVCVQPCSDDTSTVRLLFVVNAGWFFLSHRLPLAQAARAAGYEVHVACDIESESEAQRIRSAGLVFHRLRLQRGGVNPFRDVASVVNIYRLYRRVDPTIVHHVTVKPVLYGGLAARLAGVPHVVHAISGLGYAFTAGNGRNLIRTLVSAMYRVVLSDPRSRVIFQNQEDQRFFLDAGWLTSDRCVLIEGSGVNLAEFKPVPEPESDVTVVLPARMLKDKGILEFFEAACLLRAQGARANMVLAGRLDEENPSGISRAELDAKCAQSGVRWLGHVDNMPALLRSAHIVCLPSYREGLSKVLIEACAAGRPIVTTDVPGCRDVVSDGVNGLLVPAREVRPLAVALAKLIQDRDLRARFGLKSRQIAESRFDVNEVARRTLGLYDQLRGSTNLQSELYANETKVTSGKTT